MNSTEKQMPAAPGEAFEIRLETAVSLVTQIHKIHLTPLRSRRETDAFCQRERLHRIQLYLNEKVMELARSTLDSETAFVISDVFCLQFILFSIRNIPLVLGPYCPQHLTESGAAAVIRKYALSPLEPAQLLTYCGTYPSLSEHAAWNTATAMIHAVHPEEPTKNIRRIVSHEGVEQMEEEPYLVTRANHNTLIERRYAAERQMIDCIIQGDTREAVHQMHVVEQDVSYLKRAFPTLESEKQGAAILRTTVRLAAIQAGLPALVVDRLTSQCSAEIMAARDEQTVLMSKEKLIRNLCRAVQESRRNQYSALVHNTLYILQNEYPRELSIESISAEFGVTANHLIAVFKKETGITPNACLSQVRMRKAAALLRDGRMSISDISAAVGIADPNYFVKLFKKEFGETPSAYRKRTVT